MPDEVEAGERFTESSDACTQMIDWEDPEPVSIAVVEAVAAVSDSEPTSMEPLNTVVDTDALERLFAPSEDSTRGPGYVQFAYEGCLVEIGSEGTIAVIPDDTE